MSNALPLKYRPKGFQDVYGNDSAIVSVESILDRPFQDIPKSWLFTGDSGCGKTTMVRIIKDKLKCSDTDYHEYNAANTNGVDTIREINATSRLSPMGGPVKVILLDECFCAGTKILTPNGDTNIEDVKIGDSILSRNGKDLVEFSAKKRVPISRVVRLNKSDGSHTFCSEDHPYLYNGKYIPAKDLTDKDILCYRSELMLNNNSLTEDNYVKSSTMQRVWGMVQTEYKNANFLFQAMCKQKSNYDKESICNFLRTLWKDFPFSKEHYSILQSKLCGEMEKCPTSFSGKSIYRRTEKKFERIYEKIWGNRKSKEGIFSQVYSHERTESQFVTGSNRKTNSHKKIKRILLQNSWWKWEWTNRTRELITDSIGFIMGIQSSCFSGEQTSWVPNLLQDRYCPSNTKNWNRSRWLFPQSKGKKNSGFEKNGKVETIRVESVEIYKRGSNDESFSSVIGDKERNTGFVDFYDLQVKYDPSYIADGNMVHNCHMQTTAAQNAMLKMLEDAPRKTFFFLATTNPEKLLPAVKTRCTTVNMKSLPSNVAYALVKDISDKEGADVPASVLKAISKACGGSAREAVKILDQVIDVEIEEDALDLIEKTISCDTTTRELCQAIMQNQPWKVIAGILKNLDSDPESTRRSVLGYFTKVLLDKGDTTSAMIVELFSENYYDSGKAGLVLSCFSVHQEMTRK